MNKLPVEVIQVPAEQFPKYLAARAREYSAKREKEAYLTAWGLPDSQTLADKYDLQPNERLEIPVVNGNGTTIGKITLSRVDTEARQASYYWKKNVS